MIFFILTIGFQSSGEPFWKVKEKYYTRIKEERAVVVAVQTQKIEHGEALIFEGGGHANVPIEHAYSQALKFENLKEAIDEIKEVRKVDDRLLLRTKSYGYEATMWLKITTKPQEQIKFEIVEGTLTGLRGELNFAKIGDKKTEIGIQGRYDYVKFPIPKFFAEFGIEVILQRMAIRLRSYVETKFNAERATKKAS